MIRAFHVSLQGEDRSGGVYFARSAGAARYDYLLNTRDCIPDLTFAQIRSRRAPESDRLFQAVDGRNGLAPEYAFHLGREREAALRWNAAHATGTPVTVRMDSGELRETTTRSRAILMCGSAVVWLDGIPSCYALSHVTAREVADA
jgi:hypothetical protein